jgi:hypothetical protein
MDYVILQPACAAAIKANDLYRRQKIHRYVYVCWLENCLRRIDAFRLECLLMKSSIDASDAAGLISIAFLTRPLCSIVRR